jgi:hypothetical protein
MIAMHDETLEAALDYLAEQRVADEGLLPREFYFRLRLNGHTAWPCFRSTALPTFPDQVVRKKQNTNTKK